MEQSFQFTGIDGREHNVTFDILQSDGEYRSYGIRACMTSGSKTEEEAEVKERFITYAEAEATVKMLCHYQVMPCTLRDII